jgi:hypothetical protein
VKAVKYSVGDRVLVFYSPGLIEEGRKLRTPWMGPHRITRKLVTVSYLLKVESTDEVARVHVNRLQHLSKDIMEQKSPLGGIYPESRRLFLRILGDMLEEDGRWFKLVPPGRNRFIWNANVPCPRLLSRRSISIEKTRLTDGAASRSEFSSGECCVYLKGHNSAQHFMAAECPNCAHQRVLCTLNGK